MPTGDSTILLLPAAGTITGAESIPLVQGGVTKVETLSVILASTEKLINKGVANGYPSLDASGLVPASQLPAYIDDVLEGTWISTTVFNSLLPITAPVPYVPAKGIIYVDTTTNLSYRWSGSVYVKINDGSVTSFNSRVGAVLPVAGDYTKADVGLSNVDNTSDPLKPISTAQALVNSIKQSFQTLTIASSATPSITITGYNSTNFSITAQAVALTSITIVGAPNNFDNITLRIADNGVARAIALGTSFISGEAIIPSTTKVSVPLTLIFIYNSVISKYSCIFSSYDLGLFKRGAGNYSVLVNNDTTSSANGAYAISGGQYSVGGGIAAAAFGNSSIGGNYTIGSGYSCSGNGSYSRVNGYSCAANGSASNSEGTYAVANGDSASAKGRSTSANSANSESGGVSSITSIYAEWARSSAGTIGQYGIVDWAKQTSDNTTIEAFIGDASPNRLLIPTSSTYRVKITAIAKDTTGNIKEFETLALIKNISGTTSLVGTVSIVSAFFDSALNTASLIVTADDTNDSLKIEVRGITGATINWYIKGEYIKLK